MRKKREYSSENKQPKQTNEKRNRKQTKTKQRQDKTRNNSNKTERRTKTKTKKTAESKNKQPLCTHIGAYAGMDIPIHTHICIQR